MTHQEKLDKAKASLKKPLTIETVAEKSTPLPQKTPSDSVKNLMELTEAIQKNVEKTAEEKKEEAEKLTSIVEAIPEMDDSYTYDEVGVKRPNLYSSKRRKEIEDRCSKISLEDLIVTRRIVQTIPIIPDTLVIKLRTLSTKEEAYIRQQIAFETNKTRQSSSYLALRLAQYRMTFSLLQINTKEYPDVTIKGGSRFDSPFTVSDDKAFESKLEMIMDMPDDLLEELDLQFIYLKDRVKGLSMGKILDF
jgi:hypothetical protein